MTPSPTQNKKSENFATRDLVEAHFYKRNRVNDYLIKMQFIINFQLPSAQYLYGTSTV